MVCKSGRLRWFWVIASAWFLTMLVLPASFFAHHAYGAPKGGGSSPPEATSQIYFYYANAIHQMSADGSGKSQVLANGEFGRPSSRTYGGLRWWLTLEVVDLNTERQELFAFNELGETVQLTDTTVAGFRLEGTPQWSADRQDTFVSLHARVDPGIEDRGGEDVIRLPLHGEDIAAIGAGLLPRLTGDDCEFVLPPSPNRPELRSMYAWSKDPLIFAYLRINYGSDGREIDRTIWVRMLPATAEGMPMDVPIYTAFGLSLPIGAWSPDGSRLLFNRYNSSVDRQIWTIKADGSGATKVLASNGTTFYDGYTWSPGGGELLIMSTKTSIDISKYQYQILRMPAGGGKLTSLTGDLPPTAHKGVSAWLPVRP
jgi:hypothetical protein